MNPELATNDPTHDPTDGAPTLPAATHMGPVALAVADLGRSLAFYTDVLGLAPLARDGDRAALGVGGRPLLILAERPGARPKPPRATGLYHFAVLMPTRRDLARSIRRLAETRYPLGGQADHLVSEAFYLDDPDGNGIELYRDRPRDEWPRAEGGGVRMASDPIDMDGFFAELEGDARPWDGLAPGTTMGHVHLQVADVEAARRFYVETLGFEVQAEWHGALFVSAGGYHHHLGLNTWQSRNGPPAPPDAAGLRYYTIALPDAAAVSAVASRLEASGVASERRGDALILRDPWGNGILLAPGGALSAAGALAAFPAFAPAAP